MNRKLFPAAITVLIFVFSSCTTNVIDQNKGLIHPGDKIGEITVEQSSTVPYQNIWFFCDQMPDAKEPASHTSNCEVPLVSGLDIDIGWFAKQSKIESNWDAMVWELYIDGYQIDLGKFEYFEEEFIQKEEDNSQRHWVITLKGLNPGEHTLRYFWHSEVEVDDGAAVYQPGKYELTVNFTILEKPVYPIFSSDVKAGQHPYTSEKTDLDFLLYLPHDYGKDAEVEWPLIVYLHGAPLRGGTLELLKDQEPLPDKLENESDFPFIVVSPIGDGDFEFWGTDEMIEPLFILLGEIQTILSVDENRISLTGNDMGGNGVWAIGLDHPEYFAALAPIAGYYGWPPEVPENICDLKNVSVWAFHGKRDDTIPIEAEQDLVDALNACGGNAQITISPDMKLEIPFKVYENPALYEWLLSQSKK